jgi:hypothetical protein
MTGYRALIFSGLLLVCTFATAQNVDDCGVTLSAAVDEFNAGHFNAIPTLLIDCMDKFSREQRERANMLLTQTYLLLDDPIGAERSYLAVLQANPEFLADENRDPIDVVYLSKKFTATPIFSWYLNIGANATSVSVLNTWSAIGGDQDKKKYTVRPGLQFGGGLEYNLNDNMVLAAELNYSFTAYKVTQSRYFDGMDGTEVVDRQNWLMLPIIAKYVADKGKIRPYGYLGYSFNYLLRDVATIKKSNGDPSGDESSQIIFTNDESPTLNYTGHRRGLNRAFLVGGGIKYKFGLDYLFADLRFSLGMNNVISRPQSEARFSNIPWVTQYGYVEDDFRLNSMLISVGFIHPLYKPRKLKKARTKSVMKRIDKQKGNGANE